MPKKAAVLDDRKWYVVVGDINDGIVYTTAAAKKEVRNLLKRNPRLEGLVEVLAVNS